MTGYGITQADVAKWLQLDTKTLRKHYKHEIDIGAIEANAQVARSLYKNAVENENVAAQIWWTKARMGWKDTSNQPEDKQPMVIDFRWADAPAPPPEPTIEGRAEAGEPDLIEWAKPAAAD